ncbi:MAG: histidine phosphatase family protein [Candidatus Aenigmarchaeota archaeon]|nr:histidine phosphatase family protein [Candidatus Aenigmarchaeota archaeon]
MSEIAPKWPKRLVVVRHGRSELNEALDLFDEGIAENLERLENVRDVDIKLTKAGIWQAERTGIYLAATERFDICLSSPY